MPNTDSQDTSGHVSCHFLAEDFPRVLDILRNEKPVYLIFTGAMWNIARIDTSIEPIGEGELV